ncbi:ATP-dependent zinc metalloprotease FtsH [Pelotomaculum isophthalicicum JI]|uniref:ATP-dependent zinc metalloprotease FtsH n=1 Tax=Pelotomaculum isophthalicicum JI TaxID=947010 RepID=A0A9X4GZW3_9FIRM|nr:ATP-dependent zinc metalloprotease FtsH [Pelotomaculum isophthalicicum]MDF9409230.1 ATP-dependent zinc metalloprotease FtsH [Pelotomaculum isophthalicicum JI]
MNKVVKNLSIYLLIVLVIIALIRYTAPSKNAAEQLSYSKFYEDLESGQISNIVIQPENYTNIITGEKKDGSKFETKGLAADTDLYTLLKEKKVTWKNEPPAQPGWWTGLLSTLLPILLFVVLFFFLMQQTQGGGNRVMSFGKSRARLQSDEKKKVTFTDVAGADEVKEELEEIVEFLKSPRKFQELGAKIPKGVLLFGPPGTGKTLLARAVAGEAGVPFFSISGSDFVEMFVGVGASRVRDLFEQAKKNAPCIVFVDEIDAVGRQRGAGLGGGHDEREQTLNQLLVEMDGFSPNEGIIILAATNRPDILDPALLRPGRFDRQVVVDAPDVNGRKEILKVHVRGKPLDTAVNLEIIARRTPGFTGADLANLTNEAALLAARQNRKKVTMADLENSIERVIAGPEKKSKVISEKEKWLVCYHEAGHAVMGYLLPNTDPVHKVSIIPRGRAGGYTLLLPKEDRYYATKSQLIDQVTMLLGGRVAEAVVLKEISTGAQNDLERSTAIVRKMVMEYGMSDLGSMTFGHKQDTPFLGRDLSRDRNYSEEVANAIDVQVREMIDSSYNKAKQLLEEHLETLHLVAKTLFDKETVEAEEFAELMKQAGEAERLDRVN